MQYAVLVYRGKPLKSCSEVAYNIFFRNWFISYSLLQYLFLQALLAIFHNQEKFTILDPRVVVANYIRTLP